MRDYLYLWHDPSRRRLIASGLEFRDFLPVLEATGGVVLLRHEAADVQWDQESGLEYVEAAALPSFVEEGNVNTFGDFCWADFPPGGLPRMDRQELAELLFFGTTHEPFAEVGLATLRNRFLVHAHDDGWYLKLCYHQWGPVADLLSALPLLSGRSETLAALAEGDCAFWITADQVEAEACTDGIDSLMERRVWAHMPPSEEPPPQTLAQVEASLPNGFHDAYLRELTLDLPCREARMIMDLWVGDPQAPAVPDRERTRRAELTLSDLVCWKSEGIFLDQNLLDSSGLCIDMGPCERGHPPDLPPSLAEVQGQIWWLFCSPLNSLTFFCAGSASLEWYG